MTGTSRPRTLPFHLAGVLVAVVLVICTFGTNAAGAASANAHTATWSWSTLHVESASVRWELESPNARYTAVWQSDHNLVVYDRKKAIWASNTNGRALDSLVFTPQKYPYGFSGNMSAAVYCKSACTYPGGYKQWNNGVNHNSSSYHMSMQNDGNFVEYTGTSGGTALWASNTKGK
jgi:hypothetical protein